MVTYCLLPHPGVSAVFFDAAEALLLSEMALCLRTLDTPCEPPRAEAHAGLRWLCFDAAADLDPPDLARLARLSGLYALFVRKGELLLPVDPGRARDFGEDLSAILKYTGKTNTLFTRLMLSIAEWSLPEPRAGRLSLLDPVAGKGTTLYEALMRGLDASGIEIVGRAAHEAAVYFEKYLQTEKWKHTLRREKIHGDLGWKFAFARDKDALKSSPGHMTLIAGDARNAERYFGKACFDLIVGDLPYGVAHGNVAKGSGGPSRSPARLLEDCLPAWRATLRKNGVLALSWNTLVFPRVDMLAILEKHGFHCLRDAPYDALAHRVDASIRRDIAVAVRAG